MWGKLEKVSWAFILVCAIIWFPILKDMFGNQPSKHQLETRIELLEQQLKRPSSK